MSSFETYSTPAHCLQFSRYFFDNVSVEGIIEIAGTYPRFAPSKSLRRWEWLDDEPASAAATSIHPHEIVPHPGDLLEITKEMQAAFKLGQRSVMIAFTFEGRESVNVYQFSKLRLIQNAFNFAPAVERIPKLLAHIQSAPFTLDSIQIAIFRNSRFNEPLRGFHVASPPLYRLTDFLEESWLTEDVLNCGAELVYHWRHASTESCDRAPKELFFPTELWSEVQTMYHQSPRVYSPELLALRHRIESTPFTSISVACADGTHFASFSWMRGASHICWADSLQQPSPASLLPMFTWLLPSLFDAPPPTSVRYDPRMNFQGGNDGGEGSCSLATLNAMEAAVDHNLIRWSGSHSQKFRDVQLDTLLRYHFLAIARSGSFEDWAEYACHGLQDILEVDRSALPQSIFSGSQYHDFNLYKPKRNHPIFQLIKEPLLRHKLAETISQTRLPTLGSLCTHFVGAPMVLNLQQSDSDAAPPLSSLRIDHGEPASSQLKSCKPEPSTPPPPKREQAFTVTPSRRPAAKRRHKKARSPSLEVVDFVLNVKQEAPSVPIDLTHSSPLAPAFEPRTSDHRRAHVPVKSEPKDVISIDSSPEPSLPLPQCGEVYKTLDEAVQAVTSCQLLMGYRWRRGQRKMDASGNRKRLTVRCCSYYTHVPAHDTSLDPSDWRESKTIKCNCDAHVNINRSHNHPPHIPKGASAPRVPTAKEKEEIFRLATVSSQAFSRSQIAAATGSTLEPRQVSNLMNEARAKVRKEVDALGGDFAAIIASLEQKAQDDPGWKYRVKFGDEGVVTGIFWMSPLQYDLAIRYHNVLIYDSSYNRSSAGYPLGIGIVIDGNCSSRNIFYSLSAKEDIVLQLRSRAPKGRREDCNIRVGPLLNQVET
ncbi:hypothetical protein BKA70DRAFT_1234738 [Coprinopsis sp. MPI-PUGE-AT-0042]|nr:hypothetical protein BKA70DRAFT_1234738 [Coprinopsis sp. MPI-PUGE-AT-0042]